MQNVMFLKNKTAQLLVVTYVAIVVAAVVANLQEMIYSKVGCWPSYGDNVIHYGVVATYTLLPVLSILISHSRRWVKADNSMLRNIIGYAGGFSAGLLITVITTTVIGMHMGPSFEHRFGYVVCQ